jgi:hypothetical protein
MKFGYVFISKVKFLSFSIDWGWNNIQKLIDEKKKENQFELKV